MPRGGRREGAGRRFGSPVTAATREKISKTIKTNQIIKRLEEHVISGSEMPASAVTAALGLLRKVIPDLAAVTHSGQVELTKAVELTDDQLAGIATASRTGTAEETKDTPVVH